LQTKPSPQIINTIIEPSTIAIGPLHVAVTLNNRALFWNLAIGQISSFTMTHFEKDYLASVDSMYLNEMYASVLINDKLQLHAVNI
jgi:WD repeat-containing protein 19